MKKSGIIGATILIAIAAVATQAEAPAVKPGVDVLIEQDFKPLAGRRVGLITNPTGVTGDLRSTIDVLYNAKGVQLVALFGPEHGVRGAAPAGERVADAKDELTGVQVYSLYGKNRAPTAEMLKDVDALVFDIQDIGSRSYTYISTMAACMESAAKHDVDFVVLDRPNPLTGTRVEGRVLDLQYKSFVGYLPIPYVHGMTVGELAQMINGEGWLPDGAKCRLHVVPMSGWKRSMWFDDTGLPWVLTSPHVPHAETALFYAATGIMGELHVVDEGVGYTLPFELAGAPWIEPDKVAGELNKRGIAGVYFRPMYYQPYYSKYKDQMCGGVQIYLLDRDKAMLTGIQFQVMDAVQRRYPDHPLFGNKRDAMFDKVCGTERIREMFQEHKPIDEIIATWNEGLDAFRASREKYLLYK